MKCQNSKCLKDHDGSFGSGKFCSRACANSRSWSANDKLKKSKAAKKSEKVKEANIKLREKNTKHKVREVIKFCPMCGKKFNAFNRNKPHKLRTYCSLKCVNDDKDYKFKNKQPGGYRKGSGIGKSGWYKGIWCDSTYELCYVVYCLDHDIKIRRNTDRYYYSDHDGVERFYVPDFIVENEIVEIKGYKEKNFDLKIAACPTVKVLFKEDLKDCFEYVENKYGKNILDLYAPID